LSIAFAIASGVEPQKGLITAFIAGLAISAFSGSRFQIGGPTGAFIVIIYGIVQKHGYDGLAMATVLAGIMLVIMGFARIGDVIKFIPYPVTVGFTAGIAVIIFTSQVKDFLGISGHVPESFCRKLSFYLTNLGHINFPSLLIGLATVIVLVFWPRVSKKIPSPLVAIVLATAAVKIFAIPAETIHDRFGEISCSLQKPSLPKIDFGKLPALFSSAMTIAILAGIESLLSAVVADGMTGTRHKSNTELIGQGLANILSPIFGGIPATGAIARTATNIRNGGKTPIAGIVHSVVILLIFLFMGRWAELVPLSAIAGILVIVAWNMGEWHLFAKIAKSTKSDFFVLMTTFLLTMFVDLTVAIEAGLILASFLFMKKMISVTELGYVTESINGGEEDDKAHPSKVLPKGIEVFEIEGPFFFGAAMKFRDTISDIEKRPKVLILRMRYVPTIDATGLNALEEVVKKTRKLGTVIILSGVRPNLLKLLRKAEITGIIKEEMIVPNFETAVKKAKEIIDKKEQLQKTLRWLLMPSHKKDADKSSG
jgi:SulP family sulfate permease